ELPKMAAPLVRYSSSLVCRSRSRSAIGSPEFPAGDPRADAPDIVKNFINGIEPIIAFQHDRRRMLARERMIEQFEGALRHGVRMRIDKEGSPQERLAGGHPAGQVYFLDQACR